MEDVSEYFPVKNGYVMFSELPKDKRTFLKPSQPEYDQLLEKVKIGYHKNVQVTSNGNEIIDDLHQTVDQVFCAGFRFFLDNVISEN